MAEQKVLLEMCTNGFLPVAFSLTNSLLTDWSWLIPFIFDILSLHVSVSIFVSDSVSFTFCYRCMSVSLWTFVRFLFCHFRQTKLMACGMGRDRLNLSCFKCETRLLSERRTLFPACSRMHSVLFTFCWKCAWCALHPLNWQSRGRARARVREKVQKINNGNYLLSTSETMRTKGPAWQKERKTYPLQAHSLTHTNTDEYYD